MSSLNIKIEVVPFGSEKQKESIRLRDVILRKPLNLEFTEAYLAAEHNHKHVVAILDNRVVGVIVLQSISDEVLKMRQVAISGDLQRYGIGRKLVKYCEDLARKEKYQKITMHAREVAIPFYQKLDYEIVGDVFIEVGIRHYVMEKSIF